MEAFKEAGKWWVGSVVFFAAILGLGCLASSEDAHLFARHCRIGMTWITVGLSLRAWMWHTDHRYHGSERLYRAFIKYGATLAATVGAGYQVYLALNGQ